MNVFVGTDIVEVDRVKKAIEANPEFVNRVFTDKEISYCEGTNNMKYQHYAVRFAGKEAAFKAVSHMLKDNYEISWKNLEITNAENGRPIATFINNENPQLKDIAIDISLSHVKDYAVAYVSVSRE